MKKCYKCAFIGDDDFFIKTKNFCKSCQSQYNKEYHLKNKEQIHINQKKYRENNKEYHSERNKKYKQDNKEKISEYQKIYLKEYYPIYYQTNKQTIITKDLEYQKRRRKIDPAYKLRQTVSTIICKTLTKNKSGKSIIKYLSFTFLDLKNHLESLFEPWMTWQNHGKYNPATWNDKDSATWTWQIDHIIPHSDLPYTSMEDENFKICWNLCNLRPYPSKNNLLDGVKRTRHRKVR